MQVHASIILITKCVRNAGETCRSWSQAVYVTYFKMLKSSPILQALFANNSLTIGDTPLVKLNNVTKGYVFNYF